MRGERVRGKVLAGCLMLALGGSERGEDPALAYAGIIPRPVSAIADTGTFILKHAGPLFALPVGTDTAGSGVSFVLAADSALGAEGYELTVSEQGVRISAPTRCGTVLRSADPAATAAARSGACAAAGSGRWRPA